MGSCNSPSIPSFHPFLEPKHVRDCMEMGDRRRILSVGSVLCGRWREGTFTLEFECKWPKKSSRRVFFSYSGFRWIVVLPVLVTRSGYFPKWMSLKKVFRKWFRRREFGFLKQHSNLCFQYVSVLSVFSFTCDKCLCGKWFV